MSLTGWRILEDEQVQWDMKDRGKGQDHESVYVKFEMSVTSLRGDIEQTIGYMNREFSGEVQTVVINLESSVHVCVSGTDEISKEINLDKKKRFKDYF